MKTFSKSPSEQLKNKLANIYNTSDFSQKKRFDAEKFKKLAQKVRETFKNEDLLRLEADI